MNFSCFYLALIPFTRLPFDSTAGVLSPSFDSSSLQMGFEVVRREPCKWRGTFSAWRKADGQKNGYTEDGTMTKDDLVIRECPRWRLYDEERRIIVSNLVASLNCFEQFLREIKHRPSSFRGNEKFELPIRVSNSLFHPCSETHGIYRLNQISCPDIFLPSIHLRILCANTTGW